MKKVSVYRAQDTGSVQVERVAIVIDAPIPVGPSVTIVDDLHKLFETEAELVFRALKSLPGGTFDALLVRMLEEKRSHHVVPWDTRGRESTS